MGKLSGIQRRESEPCLLESPPPLRSIAPSSNGRTAGSGLAGGGSSPSGAVAVLVREISSGVHLRRFPDASLITAGLR